MSSSVKYIIFGSVLSLALSHSPIKERVDTGYVKPDTLKQAEPDNTKVTVDTIAEDIDEIRYGKASAYTQNDGLPSFHPVSVHFAMTLIVIAAFLQLMNLFFFKKDLAWIVLLLIVAGFAAAILSSRILYIQATGITERAAEVLQFHDLWVKWTLRSGFAALLLQIIYLGVTSDKLARMAYNTSGAYRKNRFIIFLIAVVMLVSAYSILRVGHFGTQLVDILYQNTPALMNI